MTSDEHLGHDLRPGLDQSASRIRPVNPFIAGAPVSGPEMFYGREDVFAFIQRNLIGRHRDTPIVLKGERRTGKTSVLYQVRRHLDPGYRCVSIDLHGISLNGIDDLLHGIATSVSDGLRADYGITIAPPDRAAFDADPRAAFESVFLRAVLAALGEDHLVLMLDEVVRIDEEVRAGRLEREVFSYLRHLMQDYPRLNFIFSLGSGLEEMQKDYAFLFSAALYHRISFLEEPAARKLITDPAREHFEVSADAVDTILRVTSGHPYYTQLVCHSLFDRWSMRPPTPVMTAEDVYAVLGEAIELGSPNLTYVWEDSAPEEKAVMAAMAAAMRNGPHPVTGSEIRATWRKEGVPLPERKLSAALRSLASREVVTGIDAYSFTVDLQRLWLDRHRRLGWVKDELADSIRHWIRDARQSRSRYLALLAALIVVAAVAGAGAATQWFGLTSSNAAAEMNLINAMPGDLAYNPGECAPLGGQPQVPWSTAGLRAVLHCTDSGLPGGQVLGYLFDSFPHLQASWDSYNGRWEKSAEHQGSCTDSGVHRILLTSGGGQPEECGFQVASGRTVLAYAWEDPSDDGFIVAQSAPNSPSSYSMLSIWISQLHQPRPLAAEATPVGPTGAGLTSVVPTTRPTLPAAMTPLVKLLPSDISDFETECASQTPRQLPFKVAGLVSALKCNDPGLPNGTVVAFQFDSARDYVTSWDAFNSWWGFNPSGAGTSCPPSGSSATAQGVTGWSSGTYPSRSGQEIECQYVTVNGTSTAKSNLEPDYVWSYPTEWAFIDGQGGPGSSFSALQNWWHNT